MKDLINLFLNDKPKLQIANDIVAGIDHLIKVFDANYLNDHDLYNACIDSVVEILNEKRKV